MNAIQDKTMLKVRGLAKAFCLHQQGNVTLPVFSALDFDLAAGECVILTGPSGAGKSTFMRALYGNYRPSAGDVSVRKGDSFVNLTTAPPRQILALRRRILGFVSQFLRVIPRISSRDLVAEPLRLQGMNADDANLQAEEMLAKLNLPRSLWSLPPATFSGGEQQRVNIARGLVAPYPILLLDEPTASLDASNVDRVVELISERRRQGVAIIGICHDAGVRRALATREFLIRDYGEAA